MNMPGRSVVESSLTVENPQENMWGVRNAQRGVDPETPWEYIFFLSLKYVHHVSHQLQHSGKWLLQLTWVAQWGWS